MPDNPQYIPDFDFSEMMRVIDEAERMKFELEYYRALIHQLHPDLVFEYQIKKN